MQARESQLHLRLHSRGPRYQARRSPPGQVIEQSGLAHAGLAAHYQCPALTGPHAGNEPIEHATFAEPVRQACCGLPEARMCRHRTDATQPTLAVALPPAATRPWNAALPSAGHA